MLMKKTTIPMVGLSLAFSLLLVAPASAEDSARLVALKKSLGNVPALELPAKAAKLVSAAKAKDREATAKLVIEAVSSLNAAAVPSVVGAIASGSPSVAGAAVVEAVTLQPAQASLITAAASSSAPVETAAAMSDFHKTNVLAQASVVTSSSLASASPSDGGNRPTPKSTRYATPKN